MKTKRKECKPSCRLSINEDVFNEAKLILEELNLKLGDVVGMLLTQIVLHRKIPFEVKAKEEDQKIKS
jgi:addiction module RelB/DinJ family antitoxin